jgi:phospholipase C
MNFPIKYIQRSRTLRASLLAFGLIVVFFSCNQSNASEILREEHKNNATTPIKHIVVIIQGGRSFDHYFGTFPKADGYPNEIKIPVDPINKTDSSFIEPFHIEEEENDEIDELEHDAEAYNISLNGGKMDGFILAQKNEQDNSKFVMGYYDSRDIPYYWKFASEYVLADKFFSPSMTSILRNSLYFISAHPGIYESKVPDSGLNINKTIFDMLENNKISWKVYIENYDKILNSSKKRVERYYDDIPVLAISRFITNQTLNSNIVDLSNYYLDIKQNNFPAVAYIYMTDSNEEAPADVKSHSEAATMSVYSLMKSKYWNHSAIILTYSESGGWYDHELPPKIDEERHGFRVPTIIISAYSKKGYVDHNFYDPTSILKFIEYSYGLPPLAKRDASANNLTSGFDFSQVPRKPLFLSGITEEAHQLLNLKNTDGVRTIYGMSLVVVLVIGGLWYYLERRRKTLSRL